MTHYHVMIINSCNKQFAKPSNCMMVNGKSIIDYYLTHVINIPSYCYYYNYHTIIFIAIDAILSLISVENT